MNITGTICPNCGHLTMSFLEYPSCIDGWEVLCASCSNCDYDVIRGFRRIDNIPDEDDIVTIMFAKPICLEDYDAEDGDINA